MADHYARKMEQVIESRPHTTWDYLCDKFQRDRPTLRRRLNDLNRQDLVARVNLMSGVVPQEQYFEHLVNVIEAEPTVDWKTLTMVFHRDKNTLRKVLYRHERGDLARGVTKNG